MERCPICQVPFRWLSPVTLRSLPTYSRSGKGGPGHKRVLRDQCLDDRTCCTRMKNVRGFRLEANGISTLRRTAAKS